MPSWWGKLSSKEAKKKAAKENFIDALHKFKSLDGKSSTRSGGSRRRSSDIVLELGSQSQSRAQSRSPSPSKHVPRCQSLSEIPQSQKLPLNGHIPGNVSRTSSSSSESPKPKVEKASKTSLFLPLPRPACIRQILEPSDLECEPAVASISSESSMEIDDPGNLRKHSPLTMEDDRNVTSSSLNILNADQSSGISTESRIVSKLSSIKNSSPPPSRRRLLNAQVPKVQVPQRGADFIAPDISMSSPSRSPLRGSSHEHGSSNAITFLGSGQCSSPGSGQTSGHNSMGGEFCGQLFWQPSRGSPEYSPIPSPKMTSPGPSSRIHSGAVTPIHPRSGMLDDAKQQSHRLPLPPIAISSSPTFSHQNSTVTSPSVPRSPGRPESLSSPASRWKKGKLLGRGTFGHVYVGFNSETGEMCAMKEVTLFADDAKSMESAKQLGQEIAVLSRFRHPNIVQYYGSEMAGDKLYIYLEYLSGGSIHKILQEYGRLGESAIRSYTQQILSGLSYLHATNTVHRDIKGANILVDPNGRVKLADFGMAKHIAGEYCPLSFKGSPYWMAPEVIRNSNGCSLAVDIWSLGCTVLEMATSKPPWSQYEGIAAMFKIGNSKELPTIPDSLSDEGKDFVKLCLQRNPIHRPTASQLLDHPFVKTSPSEKQISSSVSSDPPIFTNAVKSEKLSVHSSRLANSSFHSSESYILRNISCPVSPLGSPLLQPNGGMSPSPISSPRTTSGSSTPPTGCIGSNPFRNQDGIASSNRFSSPSYWDPEILRGVHFGFRGPREVPDRESILVNRVSQQLLKDPLKFRLSPFPLTYHHPSGL